MRSSRRRLCLVKVPELSGSNSSVQPRSERQETLPLLFSISHQLTSASHHRPQHPRAPVSLFAPTRRSLDGARLLGEQVSHPPSGSTCLAPAQPTQFVHHRTPERRTKLETSRSADSETETTLSILYLKVSEKRCRCRPSYFTPPIYSLNGWFVWTGYRSGCPTETNCKVCRQISMSSDEGHCTIRCRCTRLQTHLRYSVPPRGHT